MSSRRKIGALVGETRRQTSPALQFYERLALVEQNPKGNWTHSLCENIDKLFPSLNRRPCARHHFESFIGPTSEATWVPGPPESLVNFPTGTWSPPTSSGASSLPLHQSGPFEVLTFRLTLYKTFQGFPTPPAGERLWPPKDPLAKRKVALASRACVLLLSNWKAQLPHFWGVVRFTASLTGGELHSSSCGSFPIVKIFVFLARFSLKPLLKTEQPECE